MTRTEVIAAVLAEHYATGGYAAYYAPLGQHVRGRWGCSCGEGGPVDAGQRVVKHHRAHVAVALDAALVALDAPTKTAARLEVQTNAPTLLQAESRADRIEAP